MAVGTTAATFCRKPLGHVPPPWVKAGALFFITICTAERGRNELCTDPAGRTVLDAVRFYHEKQRWFARLFLLMPDHVHALISFPADERMANAIRNWKSYTGRQAGICWERNFFDHRIRNDESWEEKAAYIRENPVRKHLVARATDWPWLFEA